MYTFKISYNTVVNTQVYPRYSDNLDKKYSKSDEFAGSRVELNSALTFIGEDYEAIVGEPYGTEFYVTIDKGVYTDYYKGKFTINDCDIDKDMNMLTVELTTDDDYRKIDEIYTTEVLINELELPKIKVNYKRNVLVQTYVTNNIEGDSYVMNHQGGVFWKQPCTPLTMQQVAVSNDWEDVLTGTKAYCYLNDTTKAFNGIFVATDITDSGVVYEYTHEDGNYIMYRTALDSPVEDAKWKIKRVSDGIVYWISDFIEPRYDITAYTFEQIYGSETLQFDEEKFICHRALLDEDNSVFDAPIPPTQYVNPQVFCTNEQYTILASAVDIIDEIKISTTKSTQINPTEYNVNPDGKYFKKLESTTSYDNKELALNYWGWFSIWIQSSNELITAQYEFYTDTYTYGYKLSDIIDGILSKFNVSKQFISSFFSNTTNPISSDTKTIPILTEVSNMSGVDPKNNVLAINGKLTLSEIIEYLASYGLKWDLTDNHFRVEHDYFYKNGESYGTAPTIGIDLVDKTNTRNSKSWSFGKNQYTVNDANEKKYINYEVDECSDFFLTSDIELDINNEESDQMTFNGFISDVGYINAMSADIKTNGSFAFLLIDSSNNIPYKTFFAKNTTVNAQNVQASLPYTSNKYLRYNYSTTEIDIDGNTVTTEGYFRPVIQEVTYPLTTTESDPNMNKLVKTDLGIGFIVENTVNLPYNYCKIILRHEY